MPQLVLQPELILRFRYRLSYRHAGLFQAANKLQSIESGDRHYTLPVFSLSSQQYRQTQAKSLEKGKPAFLDIKPKPRTNLDLTFCGEIGTDPRK